MSSTPYPIRPPRPIPPLLALARLGSGDPETRATLLGAAAATGLLAWLFLPNLRHFVHVWSTDENYGHGFLVPAIALYFANEEARSGPVGRRGGAILGAALLVASVLGRLATELVPVGFVGDIAFLLGVAGVVATLFGASALRRYGFAIAFLGFMVPLPIALYARIASPLQLAVSDLATTLMNAIGVPAYCEGNLITLAGGHRMFVAEACSGMRQLTGFLAMTTAWAYFVDRPAWYRASLVAASIPIAMTANVVRVTVTGAISYWVDPRFASGAFHTVEGLLMIGLGLLMLGGGCRLLDAIAGIGPGSTALGREAGR